MSIFRFVKLFSLLANSSYVVARCSNMWHISRHGFGEVGSCSIKAILIEQLPTSINRKIHQLVDEIQSTNLNTCLKILIVSIKNKSIFKAGRYIRILN